jgi:CheY-like chemotaxis protein
LERTLQGKAPRILIVDDDQGILETTAELLRNMGYEARAVSNGAEAIAHYASWRPHAVLMDWRMPGRDGITVALEILEADHQAKIIIVSGYGRNGAYDIDPEMRSQFKGFISKPFDIIEMSRILSEVIEQ